MGHNCFISLDLYFLTYKIRALAFNVFSFFINHWDFSCHSSVQLTNNKNQYWLFWSHEKGKIQKAYTNRCLIIKDFGSHSRFTHRLLCIPMWFFPLWNQLIQQDEICKKFTISKIKFFLVKLMISALFLLEKESLVKTLISSLYQSPTCPHFPFYHLLLLPRW